MYFSHGPTWRGGRGQQMGIFLFLLLGPDLTEAKMTFVFFFQFNQFYTQAVGLNIVRACF